MHLQNSQLNACLIGATAALLGASHAQGELIAHYRFDETSGTTAVNEVATNGGDGVIGANVVTGVAGKIGNAVSLNDSAGQEDIVDMGNATGVLDKIATGGALTISYWLNSTDGTGGRNVAVFLGDDTDNNAYIDSGIPGNGDANSGLAQGRNRDNTNTGSAIGELFGPLVNDGVFHHIAFTVDTLSAQGAIYVDGALASTGSGDAYDSFPLLNNLEVGRLGRSSPTDALQGLVDDLQIYNTALGEGAIRYLYDNPGATIPEPTTVLLAISTIGGAALLRRNR